MNHEHYADTTADRAIAGICSREKGRKVYVLIPGLDRMPCSQAKVLRSTVCRYAVMRGKLPVMNDAWDEGKTAYMGRREEILAESRETWVFLTADRKIPVQMRADLRRSREMGQRVRYFLTGTKSADCSAQASASEKRIA